jgi:hypothetical protein
MKVSQWFLPFVALTMPFALAAERALELRRDSRILGADAVDGWAVAFFVFMALIFLCAAWGIATMFVADRRERAARSAPPSAQAAARGRTLRRQMVALELMPETPPPGWSLPIQVQGKEQWLIEAGSERILVALRHARGQWTLHVYIVPRHGKTPPSDTRCAEILGHMRDVGEFYECAPTESLPGLRSWLAIPRGMKPRWRLPEELPWPREVAVTPVMAAVRKHLPSPLPANWSVPVAVTEQEACSWPEGAWMMGIDGDVYALVTLCTEAARTKLAVVLFHEDGSEVADGTAVDVLRHFRGVAEFSSARRPAGTMLVEYLGEIGDGRRAAATLN